MSASLLNPKLTPLAHTLPVVCVDVVIFIAAHDLIIAPHHGAFPTPNLSFPTPASVRYPHHHSSTSAFEPTRVVRGLARSPLSANSNTSPSHTLHDVTPTAAWLRQYLVAQHFHPGTSTATTLTVSTLSAI